MRFHRLPGTPSLAFDLAGDGNGEVRALFLHGIGGNRTNWRTQLPAFAAHFFWPWPGTRAATATATTTTARARLRRLRRRRAARPSTCSVCQAAPARACRWAGASPCAALLHPERVATLTLVDTHEASMPSAPSSGEAFVDSRARRCSQEEPADIADPVARSLIGPHARRAPEELRRSIAALHKGSYLKSLEATVARSTSATSPRSGAGALHRRRRRSAHAAGDAPRNGRQAGRRAGEPVHEPAT